MALDTQDPDPDLGSAQDHPEDESEAEGDSGRGHSPTSSSIVPDLQALFLTVHLRQHVFAFCSIADSEHGVHRSHVRRMSAAGTYWRDRCHRGAGGTTDVWCHT